MFIVTSVSGHLMNYNFHQRHKRWDENQIYDLFDGQITLDVNPEMKDIETNLKLQKTHLISFNNYI